MADLTVQQAANRLHRSPSTVRRWLRDGPLCGYKVERGGPGGTWQVDAESCEQVAAELATTMNAGMDMVGTGGDVDTLKVLLELTRAVRELTAEMREIKALPPAPEEPAPKKTLWQRLFQGGK